MKVSDPCGCFPTGRHYPGIAHLIRVRAVGVVEEIPPEAAWQDQVIAFIDTETTGRNPAVDRVIEIGVVFGRNGEIFDRRNWLINPGMPIPAESTEIHGIKDDDVRNERTIEAIFPEILACLEGAIPAAYNAEFDRNFFKAELARFTQTRQMDKLPPAFRKEVEWLDPLVFAREIYKDEQSRALADMATRLGIELEKAHRAMHDAEAALRVLYALAKDPRLPRGYAALLQEQRRWGRMFEEGRRFWRKPS